MFHQISLSGHRIAKKAAIATGAFMALAAASVTGAQAAPITFAYEGTVNIASGGAAFDAFLGQTAKFEFTFEPTTATDDFPGDTTDGAYQNAITAISVTVGGYSATGSGGLIRVYDEHFSNGDEYLINAFVGLGEIAGADIGGLALSGVDLILSEMAGGSAITSDALLLVQPDPADFSLDTFFLTFFDGVSEFGTIEVLGLTSSSTAVAEPGTLAVFGLGLAGLGYARRRRKA